MTVRGRVGVRTYCVPRLIAFLLCALGYGLATAAFATAVAMILVDVVTPRE